MASETEDPTAYVEQPRFYGSVLTNLADGWDRKAAELGDDEDIMVGVATGLRHAAKQLRGLVLAVEAGHPEGADNG